MNNNAKIMRDTERFLKRTAEYINNRYEGNDENYEIHYVLKKSNKSGKTDVIAIAAYEDYVISIHPYTDNPPAALHNIFD